MSFAFAHDITNRKEAELKFEQQAAELLHASRLSTVGEMVAALSHEVAQPLIAIWEFRGGLREDSQHQIRQWPGRPPRIHRRHHQTESSLCRHLAAVAR